MIKPQYVPILIDFYRLKSKWLKYHHTVFDRRIPDQAENEQNSIFESSDMYNTYQKDSFTNIRIVDNSPKKDKNLSPCHTNEILKIENKNSAANDNPTNNDQNKTFSRAVQDSNQYYCNLIYVNYCIFYSLL